MQFTRTRAPGCALSNAYRNVAGGLPTSAYYLNYSSSVWRNSAARWLSTQSTSKESRKKTYDEQFEHSVKDPQSFWAEKAQAIQWDRKWDNVLDSSNPPFYRWFTGGKLNTCFNALDVHVDEGRGEQTALIYDSPVTGTQDKYSYRKLRDEVALAAAAITKMGVEKGDRVVIYMPMIPQAVIAMLACARIGAVHSVVFGGFAADQLAQRIDHSKPKLVIAASCGVEPHAVVPYKPMLDKALTIVKQKDIKTLIYQRPGLQQATLNAGVDVDWQDAMASVKPQMECTSVDATDPLYILYTSGTTGNPKGVVRDNGGHAVALKYAMEAVYGINPGDVYWAASDVGWVVGHSFIVYGPLLRGSTTVLYEGKPVKTPDAGAYWRVIAEHGVKVLQMAPTALRAIMREDPEGIQAKKYEKKIDKFKHLFLVGERADSESIKYAERVLKRPVIDSWWQTETGWPITAKCVGLPGTENLKTKHGSSTKPVPGYNVSIMSEKGKILDLGKDNLGELVIKCPLPPGTFPTLWANEKKYQEAYFADFPGYYKCGDAGYLDDDGYVFVMARTDDVINVAGHRLSTGQIEEVLAKHPDVVESAVVGVRDELKGEVPIGLVVLKNGSKATPDDISKGCIKIVRDEIGPVAAFKKAIVVDKLPKTRSGKILRAVIKKMADGEKYAAPPTIEDTSALDHVHERLKGAGFAKPAASSQ